MVTLEREKAKKYRCTVGEAPLESIAIAEKLLPAEYINTKGNFVTEAFLEYCRPVVGDPIRTFPVLSKHKLNSHRAPAR
jgi:6-phosphofructokinase 1